VKIRVLGAAAGGGFPQWNCGCRGCAGVRDGSLRAKARTQSQVAISEDGHSWYLLNASPDLRTHLSSYPDFYPSELRGSPIAGILLTNADLDHVLGLLLLREGTPLKVFATPSVRTLIEDENRFFAMLKQNSEQLQWTSLHPGLEFQLPGTRLQVKVFESPGNYPFWAGKEVTAKLPLSEAQLGFEISDGRSHLLYIPGCAEISEALHARLRQLDRPETTLLIDGTFWSDDELQRVRKGARSARAMGHLPVSGVHGSLRALAPYTKLKKVYVHINNTNPILIEDSPEHLQVLESGWQVAYDGLELSL